MSEQKVSVSVEQRIIIKFLNAEWVQPSEILQRLENQFGEACLSRTWVFEWCKTFREEREREILENTAYNGRPQTSITSSNIFFGIGRELSILISFRNAEPPMQNIIQTFYWEIKDKIRLKRKTGGNGISFLQDNVRPHTARKIMETTRKLKSDLLPHPPFYLGDWKVTWRECGF